MTEQNRPEGHKMTKAELEGLFTKRAKALRDNQIPLNRADAEAAITRRRGAVRGVADGFLDSVDERWQRRGRAPLPRLSKWTVFSGALTAGILALSGVALYGQYQQTQDFQAQMTQIQNQIDIASQTQKAADVPEPTGGKSTQDLMTDFVSDARQHADDLAAAQNVFSQLMETGAQAPNAQGNGAPSQGSLAMAEHRKKIAPFFDERTFWLSDEVAYSSTSNFGLSGDQIDPRLAWFTRLGEGGKPAPAASYTWTTSSVRLTDANYQTPDVFWLCQDSSTGEVLAWARATYVPSEKKFVSLVVGTTTLGDSQDFTTYQGAAQ